MSVCETSIFDSHLSIPYVGWCTATTSLLVISCILSFTVQFFRHWLYLKHAVERMKLLTEEPTRRSTHDITMFTLYQLLETCCWIVTLLLVVNVNIYVLLSHLVSDVIASSYFIQRTESVESQDIHVPMTRPLKL